MAPAGRSEYILPFFFPADVVTGDVPADGLPFVKNDIHRTGILQGLGEAIFYRLILGFRQLGLKGAEKLVPDNEEHAHITVQILTVRGVMYAMMRGGHQDVFQPAHLFDELGVDKDAPDLRSGIYEDDIHRLETEEGQGNKIDETIKRLEDRRPEAYREIEMFGGMMGNVYRPEKADLVIPAVQPIVEKIFCQQQQQPIRENIGDRKPVVLIASGKDQQIDTAEEQIDTAVEQHQVYIGKRIFPGISLVGMVMIMMMAVAIIAEQDFQSDDDKVERCAD